MHRFDKLYFSSGLVKDTGKMSSELSPQAPLDLGRMEEEAKANATKYVSNLLQVSLV